MVWVDAEDVLLWDALDAYFLKMAGKSYRAVATIVVGFVGEQRFLITNQYSTCYGDAMVSSYERFDIERVTLR